MIDRPPLQGGPKKDYGGRTTTEPVPRQAVTDLFLAEAETHSHALSEGLLVLERNPADTPRLEAMMRAAHSLKGAARVTGLEDAVRLGHVMEDCFVAAQQGRIALDSDSIDALLQGVDLFQQLARAKPQETLEWLAQRKEETEEIVGRLEQVRDGVRADSLAAPTPDTRPQYPAANPVPATSTPPELGGRAVPWTLFQTELRAHGSTLQAGLLAFERNGLSAAALEGLVRAAQSMRGAAGVLKFAPVLRVAQVIQSVLMAFRGKSGLESGQVDRLLHAVDFLDKFAAQSESVARASLAQTNETAEVIARDLGPLTRSTGQPGSTAPAPPLLSAARDPRRQVRGEQPSSQRDVRITSEKLDRLLGISGEAVVQAGHQQAASATLRRLKNYAREILDILERLRTETGTSAKVRELIDALWERAFDSSLLQNQWMEEFEAFTRRGTRLTSELHRDVLTTRMRPFADATKAFPRMVRDLAKGLGKKVRLEVRGPHTEVDRDIIEKLDAPLTHIVRNAIDHGMESPEERKRCGKPPEGSIVLEAQHRSGRLIVSIADDGRGINPERVREKIVAESLSSVENAARMGSEQLFEFLFLPGFSTASRVTEVSGRGVGLDVVQAMVQEVGGSVRVESLAGEGTSFTLHLPLIRSVLRTLLLEVGGEPVAVPLSRIDRAFVISKTDVQSLEGRQYVSTDSGNLGLVSAYQLLGFRGLETPEQLNVVALSDQRDRYGLVVGRFLGEQDVVVRPVDPRIGKIQDVAAIGVLHDGSPAIILDIDDVVRSVGRILGRGRLRRVAEAAAATRVKRILVADDSVTVREVVRRVLLEGGYAVELAVDGMDAWNAIRSATISC